MRRQGLNFLNGDNDLSRHCRGGRLDVANLGGAVLELSWQSRPPRRIALLQIPVLVVHFRYVGFDAAGRHAVQRRFDLATQRGGG